MPKFFKSKSKSNDRSARRVGSDSSKRSQFYAYSSSNNKRERNSATGSERRQSSAEGDRAKPNSKSRGLKLNLERLSLIAVLILVAGSLVYISTLSTSARVVVEESKKSKLLHSKQEYSDSLEQILSSSMLNKSKITVDTQKIGQQLMDDFPEVNEVNVLIPLAGRRPTVRISTDEVKLVVVSNNEAYGVGKSGKLLVRAKDKPSITDGLPTVVDDSNLGSKLGQNILTSQDVDYILNVIEQLSEKDIKIESITLPRLAAEMHIKPKDQDYIVKFSFLSDYRVAVGQYLALRKKLQAEGITPSEYIDSRVEERIYYK